MEDESHSAWQNDYLIAERKSAPIKNTTEKIAIL
jgi:hypothetical protein